MKVLFTALALAALSLHAVANEVVALDAQKREEVARMPVGKESHEISLEDWVATAAGGSASGGASSPAAAALTRTSDERSVKVEVTPLNRSAGADTLDFRVVLDTHSVELDYDLAKIAVLRDDRGNAYRPSSWQGPAGGHHVDGVLHFVQAREIMSPRPAYLELQIEGVAGVPRRSFRWESKVFN